MMVYFLYSEEQLNERNSALNPIGKQYIPGTVIVGARKEIFTQLSTEPDLPRFIDARVVASGESSSAFTYTMPKVTKI